MAEVTSQIQTATPEEAQFVYDEWHRIVHEKDVEALLDLYTEDAIMETYMAMILLKQDTGILNGKAEIRKFLEANFARRDNVLSMSQVKFYRKGYQFDGHTLQWEYWRDTPDGDSYENGEFLDLAGPKISWHRIYFGWYGLSGLSTHPQRADR